MKDIGTRSTVFTWRKGPWVSLRSNGLIYYSKYIRESVLTKDISYVTYDISDNHILSIIFHESEPQDNQYVSKLSRQNTSGARTFSKKKLENNNYVLPDKSLRFAAKVNNENVEINISELYENQI